MQGFRKDYGYSVPTKHNSVATCKTQQEIARFVLLEILCVGCEEAARIDCSGDSTTRMTLCVAHRSVICDTVPWWQKTATACSWKSAILSRRICKSDVWAIWLSLVGGFVLFCFVAYNHRFPKSFTLHSQIPTQMWCHSPNKVQACSAYVKVVVGSSVGIRRPIGEKKSSEKQQAINTGQVSEASSCRSKTYSQEARDTCRKVQRENAVERKHRIEMQWWHKSPPSEKQEKKGVPVSPSLAAEICQIMIPSFIPLKVHIKTVIGLFFWHRFNLNSTIEPLCGLLSKRHMFCHRVFKNYRAFALLQLQERVYESLVLFLCLNFCINMT